LLKQTGLAWSSAPLERCSTVSAPSTIFLITLPTIAYFIKDKDTSWLLFRSRNSDTVVVVVDPEHHDPRDPKLEGFPSRFRSAGYPSSMEGSRISTSQSRRLCFLVRKGGHVKGVFEGSLKMDSRKVFDPPKNIVPE
jgi:hypothetical protein